MLPFFLPGAVSRSDQLTRDCNSFFISEIAVDVCLAVIENSSGPWSLSNYIVKAVGQADARVFMMFDYRSKFDPFFKVRTQRRAARG